MRYPISARTGRGFTLIDLLVVIGLIALLMALLLPTLSVVMGRARRAKASATLASISLALEAYKQDFGDYPRFVPGGEDPLNFRSGPRGARLLTRALFGVAPAMEARSDVGVADPHYLFGDGHGTPQAPFGFRARRQVVTRDGESAVLYSGPVSGPYLDPDRFDLLKTNDPAMIADGYVYGPDAVILDPQFREPILYYPGLAKPPPISEFRPRALFPSETVGLYVDSYLEIERQQSMYDASPNEEVHPLQQLRRLLGDLDNDGVIGPTERAATMAPYLLIASSTGSRAGSGGTYNENPITNFRD
jgi:type II secretory pathway pseudopilin PulG